MGYRFKRSSLHKGVNMKFNVIYLDPPWEYKRKADTKIQGGCVRHYNTMSNKEIESLPVGELADENCAMFMWCTFPKLQEQIYLFKHWGFEYKTVGFNWIKTNPVNKKPFFGIGHYTKSNGEICLLGVKGKIKPVDNSVSSVIISPREEHSKKPDEVRDKIVKLFGDVPRIELFGRQKHEGWVCLGNEITGNDIGKDINEIYNRI